MIRNLKTGCTEIYEYLRKYILITEMVLMHRLGHIITSSNPSSNYYQSIYGQIVE